MRTVFGVWEMQKWFVGRGHTELSEKMSYPLFVQQANKG